MRICARPSGWATTSGDCKVTVTLTRIHGGKLATGRFKLAGGATRKLEVRLRAATLARLTSHHQRLTAQLTIVLHPHGAIAHTTTTRATF